MNLLKNLALAFAVVAFVSCSSDDEGNSKEDFPSQSEVPSSVDDINPDTDAEEDGIPEGGYSVVGRWVKVASIEGSVEEAVEHCGDELILDDKAIAFTEFEYESDTCIEDESGIAAYRRDGDKLYLTFDDGSEDSVGVEVSENELRTSGTDDGVKWVDVFERM